MPDLIRSWKQSLSVFSQEFVRNTKAHAYFVFKLTNSRRDIHIPRKPATGDLGTLYKESTPLARNTQQHITLPSTKLGHKECRHVDSQMFKPSRP